MDDARRRLREAADAHQPDRDAMLVRIEQGMTRSTDTERARSYRRRRQASWLKVWLVGFAGLGVLGLGGLAVAAGVKQLAPQRPPTVSVAPTSQASGTTPEPRASASATKPATQTPGSSPDASTPRHSASPTADGPIAARADVNARSSIYWEQNDLTIDAAQPLTALTVELRVVQSTGVQSTGSWRTAPPEDFTMSVTQSDGYLVYRWILKPGLTLPAARQVFAAQFNHGTGKRDASKDAFVVEATVAGRAVAVRGVFPSGG